MFNHQEVMVDNVQSVNYLDFDGWFENVNLDKVTTMKGVCQCNIVHLNIRSIKKHWDNLMVQIHSHIQNIDILILSEISCETDDLQLYNIDGFSKVPKTRVNKRGGGILIMYND